MNISAVHGSMQAIAFLLLFPIGGLVAVMRRHIGPGWYKYHVIFQLLATFTVFAAVGVQLYKWHLRRGTNVATKKTPSTKMITHVLLGSAVSILLIIQLLWAFFGRRWVEWMTWYNVHVALAAVILAGGISNLWLGWQLHH